MNAQLRTVNFLAKADPTSAARILTNDDNHLCDSAKKADGSRTTKIRLSHETLELIRQRGAARAAGNYQLTSELAKRCRGAIREDLKERRAAVLAEAAEAGRSIRNTRRDFANRRTKMTALQRPDGTITSSGRVMEKVIYDFYSDLFDSHVHLLPCHLRGDGYVIPSVLPSEVRHAITSVKNRTAPGPDRIRPEHLKNLPTSLVNTLARLFTRVRENIAYKHVFTSFSSIIYARQSSSTTQKRVELDSKGFEKKNGSIAFDF
ncbi:hypothetical protein ANCCEY_12590 [Ancylostoma ceylanicum]|uniref:Reverse transcriptase domain-containing protein n=1 Tax=Ancylostoma ceylanicum TaxID=53326 RepID=A0A0D6LAT6_9BILA|nr:hypothetical protein ANCCEY_12590 [Ancylostoma ceylanicum]